MTLKQKQNLFSTISILYIIALVPLIIINSSFAIFLTSLILGIMFFCIGLKAIITRQIKNHYVKGSQLYAKGAFGGQGLFKLGATKGPVAVIMGFCILVFSLFAFLIAFIFWGKI